MPRMILYSDLACLGYEQPGHPERPARVEGAFQHLQKSNLPLAFEEFEAVREDAVLLRAHSFEHLERLSQARHFDPDTPYFEGIDQLARLATGAFLAAMGSALEGQSAFSLMRPPGHHAEREKAMGFCYLNHVAIGALQALSDGVERVAIWDFDAHHGNGTEAILRGVGGARYVSVHQHPCYPGTGLATEGNCFNFPVPPYCPSDEHMRVLQESWRAVLDFEPQLVLVSAGFDAYELDPITQMQLGKEHFKTLGGWLRDASLPTAALLEGGYSDDLPVIVESFLSGWIGE